MDDLQLAKKLLENKTSLEKELLTNSELKAKLHEERQAQIVRVIQGVYEGLTGMPMLDTEVLEYRKFWKDGTPQEFINTKGIVTKEIRNLKDYLAYKRQHAS